MPVSIEVLFRVLNSCPCDSIKLGWAKAGGVVNTSKKFLKVEKQIGSYVDELRNSRNVFDGSITNLPKKLNQIIVSTLRLHVGNYYIKTLREHWIHFITCLQYVLQTWAPLLGIATWNVINEKSTTFDQFCSNL